MLRLKLAILLLFIFVSVPYAQVPSGAASEQAAEASLASRVDRLFSEWNKPDSPGCMLAVIQNGRVIYERGYGSANLDYSIPISARSVFNIASAAKQFTALSVALLARQGRLSLDDDIRRHLPEMPQYQRPVTIRHLIHHTSGIREYTHLAQLSGLRFTDLTDEDLLRLIARQRELNFNPGDEYSYSNSGYFLLAQIIQRVSGNPLPEFAAENIFRPLGMLNTNFYPENTRVVPHRATGYSPRRDGGFSVALTNLNRIGDGGLFTTASDLVLWERNFYENRLGGGGQELINQALTTGTLNSGVRLSYAFGMETEQYRGLRLIGHGGSFFGFNADMIRFPEQRFSVICLCNLSSIQSGRLTRQVADIYLAGRFREEAGGDTAAASQPTIVRVPESELAAVAGLYFNAPLNNLRRLYVRDGKLIYSRGSSESELAPLGDNRFLMLGVPDRIEITFREPRPGAPRQMLTSANGGRPIIHERVEPASYSPQQLAEFAGTYRSEEIDATYTIAMQDAGLVLRRRNVDDTPLQPQFANTFSAVGTGSFSFVRDQQNRVSGFLLNTGRIRGLRFSRM